MSYTPQTGTSRKLLAALILVSLAAMGTSPLLAQTTDGSEQALMPAQSKNAVPKKKVTQLAAVMVSPEHKLTDEQKVPISIAVTTGAEALEKGETRVVDILQSTPSVVIQTTPQGGQVFIRGVGANGDSNWVDPDVGVMLDGVYDGRAERIFSAMYDVNRLEVLRGPQGTLYGRNSTGGAINVITNDPTGTFGGTVNVQLGNYDLRHVDAAINLPVSNTFDVRVAALREKHDGYYSNGAGASNFTGTRLKALWKPSDKFSILGTLDYLKYDGANFTTVPRKYDSSVPPFVDWSYNYASKWDVDPEHPANLERDHFLTYSLQAKWDVGFGVLTIIPAVALNTRSQYGNLIQGTAGGGVLTNSTWSEKQKTLEVRLASQPDAPVSWVVGVYGYDDNNVETGIPASTGPTTFVSYGVDVPAKSRAIFGQATYPVTDKLRVTGGLRYTKDKKTNFYGIKSLIGSYNSGILSQSQSYDAVTGKLSLEYDVAKDSTLYALVARGYKAGGFSTTAFPPLAYKPEYLTDFEVGSKSRFLDNTLQLNVSLYHYLYRNYQVQYQDYYYPSPNPDDGADGTAFAQLVTNAGRGTNTGAEAELRWRFVPSTELRFDATYAHARYGDFSNAALTYLSDTPVAENPKATYKIGLEHDFGLSGGGMISLSGQFRWSDGYRVGISTGMPGGDLHDYQEAFHKTDLQATYVPATGNWTVGAWLRNLENNAQVTQTFPFGRVTITDPRTFGLNFSYNFY